MQTDLKQFTPAVLQSLLSHTWLGNARQLENEVKRLVASVRGKSITVDHLDTSIRDSKREPQPAQEPESSRSLPDAVE